MSYLSSSQGAATHAIPHMTNSPFLFYRHFTWILIEHIHIPLSPIPNLFILKMCMIVYCDYFLYSISLFCQYPPNTTPPPWLHIQGNSHLHPAGVVFTPQMSFCLCCYRLCRQNTGLQTTTHNIFQSVCICECTCVHMCACKYMLHCSKMLTTSVEGITFLFTPHLIFWSQQCRHLA